MSPSLRLLLWLRLRGRVRMYSRKLGILQSALLTVVAVLFVVFALAALVMMKVGRASRGTAGVLAGGVETWGPPAILMAWISTLLIGGKAKALAFTPADTDQLFPGPFQRRELVLYRICVQSFGALLSVFAFLYFILQAGTLLGGWLALVLLVLFLQFSNMAMSIAREAGGTRLKIAVGVPVVAFLAYVGVTTGAFGGDFTKIVPTLKAIRESRVASTILLPFEPFGRAFAAADNRTALTYVVGSFGLVLLMIALILRLDAVSLEASLAQSQKVQAALERHRKGRSVFRPTASVNVPMPSLLGRSAPIAWRQLTGVVRSGAWLLIPSALILGAAIGGVEPESAAALIPTLSIMLLFVLPNLLRFDFRADIDQIDILKTLPLTPRAVALGQLAAPVTVIALMTWGLIAGAATRDPALALMLAPVGVLAPLGGMLLMACENTLFLLFPYRAGATGVMDLRHFLRALATQLAKMITFFAAAAPAGLLGWGAYAIGLGVPGATLAAGVLLVIECAMLVGVVGWAFNRFDPARDLPA